MPTTVTRASRRVLAAALGGALLGLLAGSGSASAVTAEEKTKTCTFGADDQKLTGAKRKAFMSKCMAAADAPAKGKTAPKKK